MYEQAYIHSKVASIYQNTHSHQQKWKIIWESKVMSFRLNFSTYIKRVLLCCPRIPKKGKIPSTISFYVKHMTCSYQFAWKFFKKICQKNWKKKLEIFKLRTPCTFSNKHIYTQKLRLFIRNSFTLTQMKNNIRIKSYEHFNKNAVSGSTSVHI